MTSSAAGAVALEAALDRCPVLPVLTVEDDGVAPALVDALVRGGLTCAEVTLRTAGAARVLRAFADDGRLLVGAGTVLDPGQVDRAVAAGAHFVVSPGLDPDVVRRCRDHGIAVVPGVATASEVQAARRAGLRTLKLFPAEVVGGLALVRALCAPFPDVRFVPTGGVTRSNLTDYLAHPAVLAVGGSWMAPPALLATGDFSEVERLTADAVVAARAAR